MNYDPPSRRSSGQRGAGGRNGAAALGPGDGDASSTPGHRHALEK